LELSTFDRSSRMEVSSTIKERLERLFPCFYGQGRQSTDVAVVPDGIGLHDLEQCQAIVFVVGNNVDVGKRIDHAGATLTLNNPSVKPAADKQVVAIAANASACGWHAG
jgi:hypothetical protein